MTKLVFVILGQPQSKANSRRFIRPGLIIKSKAALAYTAQAQAQLSALSLTPIEDNAVEFEAHIYYESRRPDLDESLLMDLLQGHAYKNDRQIKVKKVYWHLDKTNPRAEVTVTDLGVPCKDYT